MPASDRPPPGCVGVEAVNPRDQSKRLQVYLRQSKMAATAKRGMGAAKELAHNVPWTLENPVAVFRGVREEGESQWLCYVAQPPDAYDYRTGERVRPWLGQVFLVFVDDDRIVYHWRWDQTDPADLEHPRDFATRCEERLL
jgi:hypothetical protein